METLRGGKISLSCNSPAALDAPFARFAPAALINFRHTGGGDIFGNDIEGGGTKFYDDRGARVGDCR